MRTLKFVLTTLIILSIFAVACKKEEGDTESPTVTIALTAPTDGSYHTGDTLHFHVHVTDNEMLHEVATSITREHDGEEVYHVHGHPDSTVYMLDGMYVIDNGGSHSDFTVSSTATDHSENSGSDSKSFHSHPM
jgi:hypothetical protein